MLNDEEQKMMAVRAEGFQRALFEMFGLLGIKASPLGVKDIDYCEENVGLTYSMELGATKKVHRKHLVSFRTVSDSNLWLAKVEEFIVSDVTHVIRAAVAKRADQSRPPFLIVN